MEIKPFRAYRFNKDVVGRTGDCVAPPYDVISPQQQEALPRKSPYNIVRIIKPTPQAQDSPQNNQYTRAAACLNEWVSDGALRQDKDESIYAYVQDFELAGAWFQRFSFVALAKLGPFGNTVKAHENTMEGPRQDRLELKKATTADLGLVLMLYEDTEHIANKITESHLADRPLIDFADEGNVRHRLFAITTAEQITAIAKMMSNKSCIIADGHHRYETGLAYAEQSGNPAAGYQMMAFTNTLHEGLIVLATHRLINNLSDFNFSDMLKDMKDNFEIERYDFESPAAARSARHKMLGQMKAGHARDLNTFGIYGGDAAFYVAKLKDRRAIDAAAPNMSRPWRALDVAVLSKLVLEPILGVDKQALAKGDNVEYVKDSGNKAKELVKLIDAGEKQVVFFMNPPKIKQIEAVAEAGERMPQKSTYFYPKVYSGLTIHKL